MTQKQQKNSWLDLIKYIIQFFFNRKKLKETKRKERFIEIGQSLKEENDKIDAAKEEKKNETKTLNDVQKRLNNRF